MLAECNDTTRHFGDFVAVKDANLTVSDGEVVGLLGANGAGKTTLIRLLLGLLRPTSGETLLFGEPPSRRTRSRIGYVPQSLGLYDDLTAAENLEFGRAVFGKGEAELPDELRQYADDLVGQLSLGIQRRIAFAEALGHEPELLVLDEPTSGVDPLGRSRLWKTIHSAARDGAGVLVTTHYMEEAEECDRLVVMAAGTVIAAGSVSDIVGDATVTVVDSDEWTQAFAAISSTRLQAALVGRQLRLPLASKAEVEPALSGIQARVSEAPASLEERFFQLISR